MDTSLEAATSPQQADSNTTLASGIPSHSSISKNQKRPIMRQLVKLLMAVGLLLATVNCQKEELYPVAAPYPEGQNVAVLERSPMDDAFIDLLHDFRMTVQALTEDGILEGTNGTGILNRLDNIERKFLQGKKKVAVNMLNALLNHLEGLYAAGVLPEEVYEELSQEVETLINWVEYGCVGAPSVIALAGLNVNLPPTGTTALPPELFVVYQDECSVLSFSADPSDQLLDLDCNERGAHQIQVWVTNPLGDQDYAQTLLSVQDNFDVCENGVIDECAPIAIAHQMVTVGISEMNGVVTIPAGELDAGSIDACETGNLSLAVRRHGDQNTPTPSITFSVEDTGGQFVELWVSDGVHSSMVVTLVLVQDMVAPTP